MSWKKFIESLERCATFDNMKNKSELETSLKTLANANPDVYWYPGSGRDLMPLVFDVPNNPTRERLFPLKGENQKRPLILWMNDYKIGDLLAPPAHRIEPSYPELLTELKANYEIEIPTYSFVLPVDGKKLAIPVTMFQVRVKNRYAGKFRRPAEGDLYTVIFSFCESEILLRQVFVPFRIQVRVVALIRQGGFSGQRRDFQTGGFEQYRDIPRLLTENRQALGRVKAYIVDKNDIEIKGYERANMHMPCWGYEGSTLHGIRT